MVLLYKAIFRVDFDQKYEFADHPGTITQTILNVAKNFWEIVGPTNVVYQINAVRDLSKGRTRAGANFSVDTNAISGNVDFDEGLSFEEFVEGKYLNICSETLEELISRFEVRNFNRVGVRLFMAGGSTKNFIDHRKNVANRYYETIVPDGLRTPLSIADAAMVIVGSFDHDIQFRLHSGPGNENDIVQFLERDLDGGGGKITPHEFAADIDIYQHNINFKGTNLRRWIKAKEPYVRDLLVVADYANRG
ncbi:hypothetical protein M2360_001750 [Rhizobium sp. SG_E_25_P2]|uniref:hypothetical protein n=1 Tax=Rhizobium sp. SG_E_25_P2 TaxID=2879942 RepID=UPI0024741282|nr:hypothetical protein [Rhizobium sp. SG_E_25_P2]MDH6266354.1 hypothetical protein [Rhizobium sp. SG_E_25_P2]